MKITKQLIIGTLLALLLVPAAFSQDRTEGPPEKGSVEFGLRGLTGTLDGRTRPGDVPFSNGFRPDILNSGINTYRDYRNSFYSLLSRTCG